MTHTQQRRIILAWILLAIAIAALARVARADAEYNFAKWNAQSLTPLPAIPPVIIDPTNTACQGQANACTGPNSPIYISPIFGETPREVRTIYYHEVGHHFDYELMPHLPWARWRFSILTNNTTRSWTQDPNAPNEQFAEAYRFCAEYGTHLPASITQWGYEYHPTPTLQQQVCHLIERVAQS